MKKSLMCPILCGALLLTGLGVIIADEKPAAAGARMAREDAVLVTITASVEAINQTNREVTVKGPLGNSVTFIADQRVKRLNEIKVGDLIKADYYVSVAAELRQPTAEEEKVPLVMLDAAATAPASAAPDWDAPWMHHD